MSHNLTMMAAQQGHSDPVFLIAQALRENDGSPGKAAAALGVSETAVRYWISRRIRVTRRVVVDVEIIEPSP